MRTAIFIQRFVNGLQYVLKNEKKYTIIMYIHTQPISSVLISCLYTFQWRYFTDFNCSYGFLKVILYYQMLKVMSVEYSANFRDFLNQSFYFFIIVKFKTFQIISYIIFCCCCCNNPHCEIAFSRKIYFIFLNSPYFHTLPSSTILGVVTK